MQTVKDIMCTSVDLANPDMTLVDAAKMMANDDVGCLPVGENDRLVGMVTDRDLCIRGLAQGLDPNEASVRECMSEGIVYCYEDESPGEAAHIMEEKQIHRLPVLNRDKRLVGIISTGDIALKCGHELTGEVAAAISKPLH